MLLFLLFVYVSAELHINLPPEKGDLLGSLPGCALVGASCPLINVQTCCGTQVAKCVDDGTGTGSGIVQMEDCKDGEVCNSNLTGGGMCGDPTN